MMERMYDFLLKYYVSNDYNILFFFSESHQFKVKFFLNVKKNFACVM